MAKLPKKIEPKAVGDVPSAGSLKERFAPQSIPSAADFGDLIDLANAAPKVLGLTKENGDPGEGVGDGLEIVSGKITCTITKENVFTRGMIMMFSGDVAPSGWVFCDGSADSDTKGAPNLKDRFIIGKGAGAPIASIASAMSAGSENTRSFNALVPSTAVSGTVAVEETMLTVAHMPSHAHTDGVVDRGASGGGAYGFAIGDTRTFERYEVVSTHWGQQLPYTSTEGGNIAHGHTASLVGAAVEGKSIAISPPYFALAFIMKT